jgi:threonine dehydrogenase-like Zn-dependent dehydrogenase
LTSRCEKSLVFGSEKLDGGQGEIVVVPEADGTLLPMPPQLKPELSILMADIFPTAFGISEDKVNCRWYAATIVLNELSPERRETDTIVVIGCGPVLWH